MKFKIGEMVKSFFGDGLVLDVIEKENINLYKIEIIEGSHKDKILWFAENELEIIGDKNE